MTELAFLGTGTMGLPMARNLIKAGFSVHANNRSQERAQPLAGEGAQVFADPRRAAQGATVMVTMLSDGDAVLTTAEMALAGLQKSGTWLQMSTIGIDATQRCIALAEQADVTFVDAPVLGTRDPAEQAKLIVLASGPDQVRDLAQAVFEAVGLRTLWLGAAGAGTRLKVVINGWIVGVVGVLAEVIALAQALDVDPQLFFDAVKDGPLDLPYAQLKGKMMMSRAFDDASFRLALAAKDGDLLLSAAAGAGLELPIMEAIVQRMHDVQADEHGDEDMAATYWASAPAETKR
ncbi:MAG: NAD(P)-dependent oxidoreductase [Actinomycetota bacterium]|nr:NAD(P)-dependent oxidoreductase [Actinomycetota bacterium]